MLRGWLRRYAERGGTGLASQSRRPKNGPRRKVSDQEEAWILARRRERNLGARRIRQGLRRLHGCRLGLGALHGALERHQARPLRRPERRPHGRRDSMALPGARVQMDTTRSSSVPASTRPVDDSYGRIRGSRGKTPVQRWAERNETTPYWDDVSEQVGPKEGADHVEQLTRRRRSPRPSK